MGNAHKLSVRVNIYPMVSGKTLYVANGEDVTGTTHDIEAESMRELMIELRNTAVQLGLTRADIEILGEFYEDELKEDDKLVWATNIFEI
ncbi:hypothetical protein ACTFR8_22565 [Bacillus cereus group sp. MYBK15-3]|uniref:hypothetical protein n=1 Tax=unclassified Bacillus cereus group TaxID=2750818 RepID=UPI003F7A9319